MPHGHSVWPVKVKMPHLCNWIILSSDKQGPHLKGPFERGSLNQWTLPVGKHNRLPECCFKSKHVQSVASRYTDCAIPAAYNFQI
jgi:hypothetical protein